MQAFDLSDNKITDKGAMAFYDAIIVLFFNTYSTIHIITLFDLNLPGTKLQTTCVFGFG